jgi:glyoxylase-like metal-dependent hydrolase (beta-lactamase superfamily II)
MHLEYPAWLPVYDILPDKAAASKQRIFDLAAREHILVLGQHFPPFPSVGYVIKQETGWLWTPVSPARM